MILFNRLAKAITRKSFSFQKFILEYLCRILTCQPIERYSLKQKKWQSIQNVHAGCNTFAL